MCPGVQLALTVGIDSMTSVKGEIYPYLATGDVVLDLSLGWQLSARALLLSGWLCSGGSAGLLVTAVTQACYVRIADTGQRTLLRGTLSFDLFGSLFE